MRPILRLVVIVCSIYLWQDCGNPTATLADITNWQTGQTIPGTEGITPGPGMVLENWNTETHNLRYADFSDGLNLRHSTFSWDWLDSARFAQANLTGVTFWHSTLTDADLSQANLTNARFGTSTLLGANLSHANLTKASFYDVNIGSSATLTGVNLTDATVVGASFWGTTSSGFTAAQLYSTASYQNRDLSGIGLGDNDLTGWNFHGQNLTNAGFYDSTLINANLSQANLTNAGFYDSTLTGADLTNAVVVGTNFGFTTITREQLYSTATYQNRDLLGIRLNENDLTGWNFAGQNLTRAYFGSSTLTDADLTGAVIVGAQFGNTTSRGFTPEQLYSTASYQNRDLSGIGLFGNDLTGWNFAGQNLTRAYFGSSTLTGADLTDATVVRAWFGDTTSRGFTPGQLYSTASYQNHDLSGIILEGNDLTGWNFAGQNLTGAGFRYSTLSRCRSGRCHRRGRLVWEHNLSWLHGGAIVLDGQLSEPRPVGNRIMGQQLDRLELRWPESRQRELQWGHADRCRPEPGEPHRRELQWFHADGCRSDQRRRRGCIFRGHYGLYARATVLDGQLSES